jgi:hypothetical protein
MESVEVGGGVDREVEVLEVGGVFEGTLARTTPQQTTKSVSLA